MGESGVGEETNYGVMDSAALSKRRRHLGLASKVTQVVTPAVRSRCMMVTGGNAYGSVVM